MTVQAAIVNMLDVVDRGGKGCAIRRPRRRDEYLPLAIHNHNILSLKYGVNGRSHIYRRGCPDFQVGPFEGRLVGVIVEATDVALCVGDQRPSGQWSRLTLKTPLHLGAFWMRQSNQQRATESRVLEAGEQEAIVARSSAKVRLSMRRRGLRAGPTMREASQGSLDNRR